MGRPSNRPGRRGNAGETSDQRRARERADAVLERERQALELFVKGKTFQAIADTLGVAYTTAHTYVYRGLRRRADMDSEIASNARAFLQLQLEALMGTWMPMALGIAVDERTATRLPPDPRAAEIMGRYIKQYAEITGALAPIKVEGEFNPRPLNAEEATEAILTALARVGAKNQVIDGHLANAGHSQHELTTGERDDALPPPVQEKAA